MGVHECMTREMIGNECWEFASFFYTYDVAIFIQISQSMHAKLSLIDINPNSVIFNTYNIKKMGWSTIKVYLSCL